MKNEERDIKAIQHIKESQDFFCRTDCKLFTRVVSPSFDEVLLKGINILEKVARTEEKRQTIRAVKSAFESNHPATQLAKRLLKELHPNCKRGLLSGFIVKSVLADTQKRAEYLSIYGEKPPFTVLVSPTMRCNLRCSGCYAGQYSRKSDLDTKYMDRILEDCRRMGVNLITVLGGEPFVYPYLLEICKKNSDMVFQVFSNGTMVDKELARKIVEIGNMAVAISIDGFKEETDSRRGTGVFDKALQAMDNLREAGGLYLFSVCTTSKNYLVVTSDEFVDLMVKKGAALGWYFNYMPVGSDLTLDLMPSPHQRNYARKKISEIRRRKPILLVDFFGDGPFVNGCLAGGKLYLHINSAGDVEPCIFCHFAVDNVKDKSLIEAVNSAFFQGIRKLQPFCHNDLHPCMLIDHPQIIRHLVKKYRAQPTHHGAEILVTHLNEPLKKYSQKVENIYKKVWDEEYQWVRNWQKKSMCM